MIRNGLGSPGQFLAQSGATTRTYEDVHPETIQYREPEPVREVIPEPFKSPLASGKIKTLVLCDPHVPCHSKELFRRALDADGDADQLVLGGDIYDMAQCSPWGQERQVNLIDDYHEGVELVDSLRKLFRLVYILQGNHDKWPGKKVKKRTPELQFLHNHILFALSQGYEYGPTSGRLVGQRDFNNVYFEGGRDAWWIQIGDFVIAHPDTFRKPTLSAHLPTARLAFDMFQQRLDGIEGVFIGHTHFLGLEHTPDYFFGECGCMYESPMDYTLSGKLTYARPHQPGYGVIYQEDGVTDKQRTTWKAL